MIDILLLLFFAFVALILFFQLIPVLIIAWGLLAAFVLCWIGTKKNGILSRKSSRKGS